MVHLLQLIINIHKETNAQDSEDTQLSLKWINFVNVCMHFVLLRAAEYLVAVVMFCWLAFWAKGYLGESSVIQKTFL